MITLLLHLLQLLPFLCGGHRQLALENLALRQQLAVYKRAANRPKLQQSDRLLWVWLSRVWPAWRQALVIVAPATVLRWQRRRFRRHWAKLSGRPPAGRPPVDAAIKALVKRMAAANPLWGAPRIHGELLRLGFDVSERTVSRLIPKRRPLPSQTWRTFLANHVCDLVSLDFFTVPTRAPARPLCSCRARSPPPARRPLQRDRASHRPLDRPADRGCLSGRLRALLSPARPRPGLRRTVSAPSEGHADPGSPHGPAQPVAESLREAAHRLDPARVSESRSGSRRKPPAPHPGPLLLLLSPGSHSSLARQGCAGRAANRAAGTRHGHPDPRSRRPPSSLPPAGGLISPHPSGPGSPVCHARALLPSGRSPWSTSRWSARRNTNVYCAASDPFLDSPGVPSPVAGASAVVDRVGRVLAKDRDSRST